MPFERKTFSGDEGELTIKQSSADPNLYTGRSSRWENRALMSTRALLLLYVPFRDLGATTTHELSSSSAAPCSSLMASTSAVGVWQSSARLNRFGFGRLRLPTNTNRCHFPHIKPCSKVHTLFRSTTERVGDGVANGDGVIEPLDVVVFTVIVDDLVFPDGTTKMGVLGRV